MQQGPTKAHCQRDQYLLQTELPLSGEGPCTAPLQGLEEGAPSPASPSLWGQPSPRDEPSEQLTGGGKAMPCPGTEPAKESLVVGQRWTKDALFFLKHKHFPWLFTPSGLWYNVGPKLLFNRTGPRELSLPDFLEGRGHWQGC